VNNDVHHAHIDAMEPTANDVNVATHSYIRIATDRLC
jgi:hypothetical protein